MNSLNLCLTGAIIVQCFTVSLFFIRYAQKSRDIFFRYFATAFILLAVERIVWIVTGSINEFRPVIYLFRLLAFSLIIIAVLQKNRSNQ